MPWFGKGHNDVPGAWAAALERVLEAVDLNRQVAEFVLTGQHAEALKKPYSGHPWGYIGHWDSGLGARGAGRIRQRSLPESWLQHGQVSAATVSWSAGR